MPNTHSTLTALFSDIADSIRSKAGTSAPIVADAFPAAIDAIPTGGGDSVADGIIDKTISGAYTNVNVSKIGELVFQSCGSLTKANFPACTSIGGYAFQFCESLTEVSFPACTNIGTSAFNSCSSLTKANFPACTSIGSFAFQSCKSLTEVSFPACASIGTSAFNSCSSLTKANFPACTSINASAFRGCSSLTEASFPACANISSFAFQSCRRLLSLYLLGSSVPYLNNVNVFSSTPISNYTASTGGVYGSIIVQASKLDTFKAATNWSLYSSRFSVWNGID